MKVAIAGLHPLIQPGFCGVMSLFEAKWLSSWGHEVVLYIPFQEKAELKHILKAHKLRSLNDLPRAGGAFSIEPIFLDNPSDIAECDVLIWQLTSHEVWDTYLKRMASKARILTKNFPKLVSPRSGEEAVRNTFKAFDFVALALKEDEAAIRNFGSSEIADHQYRFVGRGADPDLFNVNEKSPVPFIAVDVPNTLDDCAIEHFFEPVERLRKEYPDLKVVSLGREIGIEGAECLPFMPYDEMARKFINPAWLYCVIDYAQSAPHVRGSIHKQEQTWKCKAIYEVQNVEAQMAGAVLCGYHQNIVDELVDRELSATFEFPADADTVFQRMKWAIDNNLSLREKVRGRVENMHDWQACIARWEAGLQHLLDIGYDRNLPNKGLNTELETSASLVANRLVAARAAGLEAALDDDGRGIVAELCDRARGFVEFGAGGSTRIASKTGVGRVYSIETDPKWIELVQTDPHVADLILGGRIRFIHADVGETREWGYPVELTSDASDAYLKRPWSFIPTEDIDFVFVDGRFRVATTVSAALRTDSNVLYAVDDYVGREHYQVLEELFDVYQRTERMIVLKKGDRWSFGLADSILSEFRMDPR